MKLKARKLDTAHEDLETGRAQACREALELARDEVGVAKSELPLVARDGRVYVVGPRPRPDGEQGTREMPDAPRVVRSEA
eukprot:5165696-Alexandrium_andersonii.AAC.1